MNAAAERLLLDYARWLTDRQAAILTSLESRASAIVGWSSTQVAITLGVLTLLQRMPDTAWRTSGAVALAVGVAFLAVAVGFAALGVLFVRPLPGPKDDLRHVVVQMRSLGEDAREEAAAAVLLDSLMSDFEEDAHGPEARAMVIELGEKVTRRANYLKCAIVALFLAVVADVTAATLLAIASIQPTP